MSSQPIVKAISMHPMSEPELQAFQDKVHTLLGGHFELSVHVHVPSHESAIDTSKSIPTSEHNPELKKQWVRYFKKMG